MVDGTRLTLRKARPSRLATFRPNWTATRRRMNSSPRWTAATVMRFSTEFKPPRKPRRAPGALSNSSACWRRRKKYIPKNKEHRQDLQGVSGFDPLRKILRHPVNPVYVLERTLGLKL